MFAGGGTLAVCTASPRAGAVLFLLLFPFKESLRVATCRSEFIRERLWSLILFMRGIRG